MKKWFLAVTPIVAIGSLLLSGCAPGVAPEDFAKVQNQIKELSAISAYNVWYDQYHAQYFYKFDDVAAFNTKLGALIEATGDSDSQAAWNAYLAADTALNDIVAALPEDYESWTEAETNQWSEATTSRYNALGEVGTALYNTTDLAVAQDRIIALEVRVGELSAIAAYTIWYDQYHNIGTAAQAYAFTDVATFNYKLGTLVNATGDADLLAAWYSYLAADTALNDLVAELPEDYETWTTEQYNQWFEADTSRTNALGQVGTALFNTIAAY